jgi:hypothetical protein
MALSPRDCALCGARYPPKPYASNSGFCSEACRKEAKRRRDARRYTAKYRAYYLATRERQNARSQAYYAGHRADLLAKKRTRYIASHRENLARCHCGRWYNPKPQGRRPRYFCSPACRERLTWWACANLLRLWRINLGGNRCKLSRYQSLPLIETATNASPARLCG